MSRGVMSHAPRQERVQGMISEFDSGGFKSLSLYALASAHPGSEANCRFMNKANLCMQNRKSFPDLVPERTGPMIFAIARDQSSVGDPKTANQAMHPNREVGRIYNGGSLVATG
jgi:hypothetical protein